MVIKILNTLNIFFLRILETFNVYNFRQNVYIGNNDCAKWPLYIYEGLFVFIFQKKRFAIYGPGTILSNSV